FRDRRSSISEGEAEPQRCSGGRAFERQQAWHCASELAAGAGSRRRARAPPRAARPAVSGYGLFGTAEASDSSRDYGRKPSIRLLLRRGGRFVWFILGFIQNPERRANKR